MSKFFCFYFAGEIFKYLLRAVLLLAFIVLINTFFFSFKRNDAQEINEISSSAQSINTPVSGFVEYTLRYLDDFEW